MKDRIKIAIKESGYTVKQIALMLGLSYDAFRKGISRGSLNEGYLILLENKTGISKEYILEGVLPIIKSREQIISDFIGSNIVEFLDSIEKEKIISYMCLKEKEFNKIHSFNLFIEKQKVSNKLKEIFSDEEKTKNS